MMAFFSGILKLIVNYDLKTKFWASFFCIKIKEGKKNGTISISEVCFIKTIYQNVQNEKEQIERVFETLYGGDNNE